MATSDEKLLAQIAVGMLPGIGSVLGKNLIAYCGGAEAVMQAKTSALEKIEGVGRKTAMALRQKAQILKRAEKELAFVRKHTIQTYFFTEEEYPNRLKHAIDSPLLLYYKGTDVLNHHRILAIVGTRKMTSRGSAIIEKLITDLKDTDIMVVSGLAYGVDAKAQRVAVQYDIPTVGVVAHGLDRLYPAANADLAKSVQQNGGILTEFPSGTKPEAFNFPARNRIIAGMADATLVVESAQKGGSLITANIANSYNRDVFAMPGRANDKYSKGCNFLIKTNRAMLVEDAKDLIYQMGWDIDNKPKEVQKKLFVKLSSEEEQLLEVMKAQERWRIDELAGLTVFKNSQLAAMLLNLEFEGLVKCMPGNMYKPL